MKIIKPFVLGFCGGSGSGKSYITFKVVEQLSSEKVSVLDQDSYYKDLSHLTSQQRASVNFDHPNAIDFDRLSLDLENLIAGIAIEKPVYDFSSHTRTNKKITIVPSPVIIIEGHHIFCHDQIVSNIEHKVYLDVDMDIRFIRRLMRDIKERGRDVESIVQQYLDTVRPMDIEFIQQAKLFADNIITSNNFEDKLSDIIQMLRELMGNPRGQH